MKLDPAFSVGPIRPSSPLPFETDEVKKQDPTFGEILKNAVDNVEGLQKTSNDLQFKLAMGEVKDIHEVMIAMEKASIAMSLTMEIRDKVMEAYQTIMRTAM